MKKFSLLISITLLVPFTALFADEEIEEVVVTGSQIKGAKITGVLPVTVLSSDDIDAIGPEDGTKMRCCLQHSPLCFGNLANTASANSPT